MQILPERANNLSVTVTNDAKIHVFWKQNHVTYFGERIVDNQG